MTQKEYIERGEALAATCRYCSECFGGPCESKCVDYCEISNIPAADVVEVVRCKDCKHNVANWEHDELDVADYTDIVCDYFMTDGMTATDYCSYGVRKDGAKNDG